jgi:cell division protein YceG involved in septum cleavage
LVYLQLNTFNKKVWSSAEQLLTNQKLNWYQVITLASIVEKEERNNANRSTVA